MAGWRARRNGSKVPPGAFVEEEFWVAEGKRYRRVELGDMMRRIEALEAAAE